MRLAARCQQSVLRVNTCQCGVPSASRQLPGKRLFRPRPASSSWAMRLQRERRGTRR